MSLVPPHPPLFMLTPVIPNLIPSLEHHLFFPAGSLRVICMGCSQATRVLVLTPPMPTRVTLGKLFDFSFPLCKTRTPIVPMIGLLRGLNEVMHAQCPGGPRCMIYMCSIKDAFYGNVFPLPGNCPPSPPYHLPS